ncbi:MAG: ParD-like family protein [Candidatus Thiodiazotropha sp. (ex Lucinoma kastoroae)]|nr:ParD-like family protein [Candidatus Thiodiazotropha sp. (ex Rostrolucina anterorostrata)]MCU7848000.1 ParD-like family protein [Candidatus Thiodiazotropha sp. (ex Lucinoma kastoroae)]MCU7860179.1 ParD-like family protein [Candidatus Thiodiazotropha sp. (ex Lucinoma kastoroae)]
MAKALSPVRLQSELMQAATVAGARMHRSAAEQVEYWASLGRQIASFIDPDTLLEIAAGLARLKVEPTVFQPVDADTVFAAVEADRGSGELSKKVTTASIRYQASVTHPGYLEQIDANGVRTVGTFHNGIFTPVAVDTD